MKTKVVKGENLTGPGRNAKTPTTGFSGRSTGKMIRASKVR